MRVYQFQICIIIAIVLFALPVSAISNEEEQCSQIREAVFDSEHPSNDQSRFKRLRASKVSLDQLCSFIFALGWDGPYTPMQWAINYGEIDSLRLLISAGANVNAQDEKGYTALIFATLYNNPEAIKILIKAGANPNTPDHEGQSPIMKLAVAQPPEHVASLKLLLRKGAQVNATDNAGNTALILAAGYRDNFEFMRSLISSGSNVNIQNTNGETALTMAVLGLRGVCPEKDSACVEPYKRNLALLVDAKSDLSLRTRKDKTALSIAIECGLPAEILKLLHPQSTKTGK